LLEPADGLGLPEPKEADAGAECHNTHPDRSHDLAWPFQGVPREVDVGAGDGHGDGDGCVEQEQEPKNLGALHKLEHRTLHSVEVGDYREAPRLLSETVLYQRHDRLTSSNLSLAMKSSSTRLRTPAAILDTAAHLLAERRDASMNDIAAAAGVGRATLYRYFPTREALVQALADEALAEVGSRLADAGLDTAPFPEALQRLCRAVLAVGDRYVVLLDENTALRGRDTTDEAHRNVVAPIETLFERGQDDGILRDDVEATVLVQLFGGMVVAAINASLLRTMGIEQAAALTGSLFLDGGRRHGSPSRR